LVLICTPLYGTNFYSDVYRDTQYIQITAQQIIVG
jgi:hypothetical protein